MLRLPKKPEQIKKNNHSNQNTKNIHSDQITKNYMQSAKKYRSLMISQIIGENLYSHALVGNFLTPQY